MANTLEKAIATIIKPVAGSSYEQYHHVPWEKANNKPKPEDTVHLSNGNPNTFGWYPRGWHNVLVAGVHAAVYNGVRREHELKNPKDAVAYSDGEKLMVAELPEGVEFGRERNGQLRTAGFREGPGDLDAGMGLVLQDGTFVSFKNIQALGRFNIHSALENPYQSTPVF